MHLFIVIIVAYLIGSIPFAFFMGKMAGKDLTQEGSGNLGSTNTARVVGPVPGLVVFMLDLLKGSLSIMISQRVFNDPYFTSAVGLAVILGHTNSIFLKLQGGRGVAVGLGVLVGINTEIFTLSATWAFIIILLSQYVSLASVSGTVLATVLMLAYKQPAPYCIMVAVASGLIVYKHIPNIQRLIAGKEKKIMGDNDED